jgi:hypothetical protein
LIDFKHLEKKKNLPFFVYFYNLKNCINRLYIESKNDLYKVTNLLKTDYPINETEIFIYNKKELK